MTEPIDGELREVRIAAAEPVGHDAIVDYEGMGLPREDYRGVVFWGPERASLRIGDRGHFFSVVNPGPEQPQQRQVVNRSLH
jgi:hypothetical protein